MFFPTILKTIKNKNKRVCLMFSITLLILLSKIDLMALLNPFPKTDCIENIIAKNERTQLSFNSSVDFIKQINLKEIEFSTNIQLNDSDASFENLNMNHFNDFDNTDPSILLLKKQNESFDINKIILLKKTKFDRIRGSRKKLGIYMVMAGVSIVTAALIINFKR